MTEVSTQNSYSLCPNWVVYLTQLKAQLLNLCVEEYATEGTIHEGTNYKLIDRKWDLSKGCGKRLLKRCKTVCKKVKKKCAKEFKARQNFVKEWLKVWFRNWNVKVANYYME